MVLHRCVLTLAAGAVLLGGCADAGGSAAYDPDEDTSVYDEGRSTEYFDERWREPYEEQASLPDGRDVRLWFSADGERLVEQHRAPGQDSWTAPQVVADPGEPDPCQGITVTEEDGVVAVAADFGGHCDAGEPPMASIAAVGTGDLTGWDVHVTRGFDGWTEVRIADGEVQWTGRDEELTWSADSGFSEPSE